MSDRLPRLALTVGLALGVVGCHTVATAAPRPAVLVEDSPAARETIKKVLLAATRDGVVSFGQSDLSKDPLIVVQPPRLSPYEGNSPAMPIYYDLVTDGKTCSVRERAGGKTHPLPGVACRPK